MTHGTIADRRVEVGDRRDGEAQPVTIGNNRWRSHGLGFDASKLEGSRQGETSGTATQCKMSQIAEQLEIQPIYLDQHEQ
jgi:hypothetical protein